MSLGEMSAAGSLTLENNMHILPAFFLSTSQCTSCIIQACILHNCHLLKTLLRLQRVFINWCACVGIVLRDANAVKGRRCAHMLAGETAS